ncbi:MAG: hypothetical protein WAO52_06145 [Prolixibacteraceae bacterium]
MASRRRLKKEIDYLVSDLILDCFTYANMHSKPNDEESMKIVQEILVLRNDMRNQANHPEKKAASESSKKYYGSLSQTLFNGVENGYEKLGKLLSSQA